MAPKQGEDHCRVNMDSLLLNTFRDKVNEYDLMYHIYRNYNGKNKWSVICSAMDWIQVGISGIDISLLEKNNTDQASVKLITFISCVDVAWEGIQQIHRVFFDTTCIPFEGDNNIFQKRMDDNRYWKEIRAAFAAHPTNLVGKNDGEPRRYASWSGSVFDGDEDFCVFIYSNDPEEETTQFSIKFEKILRFINKRYEYLNVLAERIDIIIEQWCNKWENIKIPCRDDVLEEISVLLNENAVRIDNDYLEYRLTEIKQAFEIVINGEHNQILVNEYRDALKNELCIIRKILQDMNLDYEFEPINDSADLKYCYANQYVFEPGKGMLEWAINCLSEPLGRYVDFDVWETIDELQVIVNAGWWRYHIERGNAREEIGSFI